MTATVTVWSDIHCPWAFVAVHRLRSATHSARTQAEGADLILTAASPTSSTRQSWNTARNAPAAFDVTDAPSLERFFQDLPTPIGRRERAD
ncbi:MAG TPA: hypothetical protein VK735_23740 [Pseudonocardia sp.]|uniref:hypothetical protein n=1 Tax=Pseudonocardia sp. TaxID=60912 RepID=UPI002C75EA90|nr:hypothetical protein [Pseudonocardia sp.]HTF50463.1 hypothetical protein [Pseudonocardia sp.]